MGCERSNTDHSLTRSFSSSSGRISRDTFDFLTQLSDDQEWLVSVSSPISTDAVAESVFRQAEKQWKAFIEALTLTDHIAKADLQIPHLPSKDVIHRIYRDVSQLMTYSHSFLMVLTFQPRSGSVTPRYKINLSASFSQSGRKGIVAHCTSTFLHSPLTRTT